MNDKLARNRRIIILCLLIVISLFSVGYAALAENLFVTSSSKISANWDIEIIDIKTHNITGSATTMFEPKTLSSTSVSFGVNLTKPNDSITYRIKIKNNGTINAYLSGITVSGNNTDLESNVIKYSISGVSVGKTELSAGSQNIIDLKIYYDDINNVLKSERRNYVINFIYEQKRD